MTEVPYALLQCSLNVPSADQLRRAFESVRRLTAADAPMVANDAYGVLVQGLPLEDATVLAKALTAEGIETELVPEKLLPRLPSTKTVRRLEFGEDCLIIHDPTGRKVALDYRQLTVLAAGEIEVVEFKRSGASSVGAAGLLTASPVRFELEELDRPRDLRQQESRVRRHWVELIVGRAMARITLEADKDAHLLFRALGDKRTGDFLEDLSMLIRTLSAASPKALLNRGAFALRAEPPSFFSYPSRHAFHEELTWILWQAARNNYGEACS